MTVTTTVLGWHGDPALRERIVARMRQHRTADAIVQGLYQEFAPELALGYRGCAVGCLLDWQRPESGDETEPAEPECGWHGELEQQFGIPSALAGLIDSLFEALPTDEAPDFALAVVEAVPVGRDLSLVVSRLMLDILADEEHGVRQHTDEGSKRRAAVDAVAALYRRGLAGTEPSSDDWDAGSIAAHATYAAAARTAEAAATGAYGDAATYAAYAHATYADFDAARRWQADRLIHHVTSA